MARRPPYGAEFWGLTFFPMYAHTVTTAGTTGRGQTGQTVTTQQTPRPRCNECGSFRHRSCADWYDARRDRMAERGTLRGYGYVRRNDADDRYGDRRSR